MAIGKLVLYKVKQEKSELTAQERFLYHSSNDVEVNTKKEPGLYCSIGIISTNNVKSYSSNYTIVEANE